MEDSLVMCGGCHRHVRRVETACPFCDARVEPAPSPTRPASATRVAFAAALLVASGTSLAACYGGPPHPQPYRRPTTTQPDREQPPPQPAAPSQQRPVEPE
ncbi:MAG: hypothetical protein R3A48_29425 [Polyangiales bacterium]